ncbi:hypothetical protein E1281_02560 [Actinomadura sp. KC345]|uniref:SEC-C metal-binding domain-containing protein n=1 Tax=Actinomadura sp. KC345 TaxID=2530371 RepID=UPI00104451D6|nr:SEC-C metal-binding domain-containing protein [Actinomadura sp. KC345]TDC58082.1 hypothetical protein E1281_02560 [Actinomadura sp. KC345]
MGPRPTPGHCLETVPLSETKVKRGDRTVGVDTELVEKIGGNDPCPCGSGRRFPALLPSHRTL